MSALDALLAALLVASLIQTGVSHALVQVATIPLPGVEGRIDHLAFDPVNGRLYVAALGNDSVEVVDLQHNVHVRSLRGFREPQGIAVARSTHVVAVANGRGEGLQLVTPDGRLGSTIRLGDDADNVRYDSKADRLYVGYGDGALAAVDPVSSRVLGNVELPNHPESFQLEPSGARIYVNVPSAQQLVVVDRSTMKVTSTWPVKTARANYPLALDEEGRRLFIGCRQPAKVLVYETTSGKELASFAIVGDTDDLFFDASRHQLYVVGGEGFIDVFDASEPYTRLQRIATAPGARTALFVPELGQLVVAVPHRGAQMAEVRVYANR